MSHGLRTPHSDPTTDERPWQEHPTLDAEAVHPRLQRIAQLARAYFGLPAAVTVLAGDRTGYPAVAGLPLAETPRAEAFCHVTSSIGQAVVVEDALDDPRFAHLVPGSGVRFYAGAPLRDRDGRPVAVLCVFGDESQHVDADQRATLLDLAGWAERELLDSDEMTQA